MPNTITVTLSVTFAESVAADINTTWTNLSAGSPGTLYGAIGAGDTSLTLSPSAPMGYGFVSVAVGDTIRIDGETMTVVAIDGNTLTVVRATSPLLPIPAPHAVGATVFKQQYATPWLMIADQALRPWAQQTVLALGNNSATFGSHATGTLAAA